MGFYCTHTLSQLQIFVPVLVAARWNFFLLITPFFSDVTNTYLKASLLYFMCPDHVSKAVPFQKGAQGVRAAGKERW